MLGALLEVKRFVRVGGVGLLNKITPREANRQEVLYQPWKYKLAIQENDHLECQV